MANIKFTIYGRLPGLNDYITACRGSRGKYAGASMKSKSQAHIERCYMSALGDYVIKEPVKISYVWYEPNKKRDKDNIAFAKKFIQDALVELGVLKNDGWANIVGFTDEFKISKDNPRVEVTIKELGE